MTITRMQKIIGWPIILTIYFGIFGCFYWSGKRNNDKFYKLKFNSLIVERNNWQLRTTEFYMQNGLRIDSNAICDFKLKLGDSITKEANSDLFKVYRKDTVDGKYHFLIEYDHDKH